MTSAVASRQRRSDARKPCTPATYRASPTRRRDRREQRSRVLSAVAVEEVRRRRAAPDELDVHDHALDLHVAEEAPVDVDAVEPRIPAELDSRAWRREPRELARRRRRVALSTRLGRVDLDEPNQSASTDENVSPSTIRPTTTVRSPRVVRPRRRRRRRRQRAESRTQRRYGSPQALARSRGAIDPREPRDPCDRRSRPRTGGRR